MGVLGQAVFGRNVFADASPGSIANPSMFSPSGAILHYLGGRMGIWAAFYNTWGSKMGEASPCSQYILAERARISHFRSQGVPIAPGSENQDPNIRVVETVVLENGHFVPCRKQVVLTKIGKNSDIAFRPQKQGILLLAPRKSTKMTKMAGVTPAK